MLGNRVLLHMVMDEGRWEEDEVSRLGNCERRSIVTKAEGGVLRGERWFTSDDIRVGLRGACKRKGFTYLY
jgi:hypothetical protein